MGIDNFRNFLKKFGKQFIDMYDLTEQDIIVVNAFVEELLAKLNDNDDE